jgi:bacterioferritin-associated ferredoxin
LKTIIRIAIKDVEGNDEMILCVCRGVSDREVAAVVEGGAATIAEVRRRCGAGTDCGSCLADIKALLADARACPRAA